MVYGQSQAVERLLLIQCCMALAHVHGKIVIEMHTHGDRREAINTATPQSFHVGGVEIIKGTFQGYLPLAVPRTIAKAFLMPFLQPDC